MRKDIAVVVTFLLASLVISPVAFAEKPSEVVVVNEVTVNNGILNPVPVEGVVETIEPALVPFQAEGTCYTTGSNCPSDIFTVPTGKLAIVEYASAHAYLPANNAISASVYTTLNSVEIGHGLSASVVSPTERSISIGQQVRLYADPGTVITMAGGTAGEAVSSGMTVFFSISGHLVDSP